MQNSDQFQINITVGPQHQGSLERALFSTLITMLCCTFLYINGVMLFTLRCKPVFRESSRYILLFNLLFADTAQLVSNIVLYLLAVCWIKLTFYMCGAVTMFSILTATISPLTLTVMSLERFVAVCYPLRHAAIITIRSTGVAITMVWVTSSLSMLIRVFILLCSDIEFSLSLQMNDFCSKEAMFLVPISYHFDKAYTYVVFLSAGVAIICSYIALTLVARSASTDKASARKAGQTLLLHLFQLGLILTSTLYSTIITAAARGMQRLVLVRIYNLFYICFNVFPRCLSTLIYGFRDQTIRPILMYHLCIFCRRLDFLSKTNAGDMLK